LDDGREPFTASSTAIRCDNWHDYRAGHGFFYYHTPMYRPEAAMDGWAKVFTFFSRHLSS
jgi:dienelactone hydrolase